MKPSELQRKLTSRQAPVVIDVRSGMEYRRGHIPGALHLPLWKIMFRMTGCLPQDKGTSMVLLCEHGPRAQMAGSMLVNRGYTGISYLDGDMVGWRRAGLPLEK